MAKKFKLILAAVLTAVTFGGYNILATNAAYADENEQHPIHIQVSPVKQKISIAPGSKYSGTFSVQNVGTEQFSYTVYATPYSVTGENYDPNYETVTAYSHISEWITFDKKTEKGTLQPGTDVDVRYYVDVPADAPAGTQYAVLMAQTEDGNADNATISVIHRIGTVLAATVPGETRASGEIIKNTVNSFYFNPPLTVSSLVKNTGNIELTATYTVRIYPLFSNEAVFSNEDSPETRDVIPETSRFNAISWEGAPQIGIFWVDQTIDFAGETSTNAKLVLICPLWLLFVIFALIFFIIFWLVSRARDRKRAENAAAGRTGKESKKATNNSKEEK